MTEHVHADSIQAAWNKANSIFPTEYTEDSTISSNAGYPVYRSTLEGCNAWISDLGNSIEVNLDGGKTVHIWVDTVEEEPEVKPEVSLAVKAAALAVAERMAIKARVINFYDLDYATNPERFDKTRPANKFDYEFNGLCQALRAMDIDFNIEFDSAVYCKTAINLCGATVEIEKVQEYPVAEICGNDVREYTMTMTEKGMRQYLLARKTARPNCNIYCSVAPSAI